MKVPTLKKIVALEALGRLRDTITGVYILKGETLTLEVELR